MMFQLPIFNDVGMGLFQILQISIYYDPVCKTAPATPVLLNIKRESFINIGLKPKALLWPIDAIATDLQQLIVTSKLKTSLLLLDVQPIQNAKLQHHHHKYYLLSFCNKLLSSAVLEYNISRY